ncbi:hypothetical protein VTO42DRAFT_7276 [Malbranchea cinnamomea]
MEKWDQFSLTATSLSSSNNNNHGSRSITSLGSRTWAKPLIQDEAVLAEWEERVSLQSFGCLCPEDVKRIMTIPMPCYTPTLDASLPPTVLYVSRKCRRDRVRGGHNIYLTARDAITKKVEFVVHGFRDRQSQISSTTLHRGSALGSPCITTTAAAPKPDADVYDDDDISVPARPLQHRLSTGNSIREIPDKVEGRAVWTPRRFNFGGRKFVWSKNPDALYEFKTEWTRKGDRFIQAGEQRFGVKLAWVESPFWAGLFLGRHEVLHIAGGLDQTLVEIVVASALTKSMIVEHCH